MATNVSLLVDEQPHSFHSNQANLPPSILFKLILVYLSLGVKRIKVVKLVTQRMISTPKNFLNISLVVLLRTDVRSTRVWSKSKITSFNLLAPRMGIGNDHGYSTLTLERQGKKEGGTKAWF